MSSSKLVLKDKSVWMVLPHLNGKLHIGDFVQMEDGYYEFFPEPYKPGCVPVYVFEFITKCWHELNDAWDEQIRNDPVFNNQEIEDE